MSISSRELSEFMNTTTRGIDFTGLQTATSNIFTTSLAAKSVANLGKIAGDSAGGIIGLESQVMTLAEGTVATLGPVVAKVGKDMPGADEFLTKTISSGGATRIAELDFDGDEIGNLFSGAKPLLTSASTMLHDIITDASPEALGLALSSITGKTMEVFAPAMKNLASGDLQDFALSASQDLQEDKGIQGLVTAISSLGTSFGSVTGKFFSGNFLKDLTEHKSYSVTNGIRQINLSAPETILESITNKLLKDDTFGALNEAVNMVEIPASLQTTAVKHKISLPSKTKESVSTFVERMKLIDPTNPKIAVYEANISSTELAVKQQTADVASSVDDGETNGVARNVTSEEVGQPKSFSTLRSREEMIKYIQSCERNISTMVVHWSGHYSDAFNIGAPEMDKEYISHGLGFTEQPYHFVIKKNGDVQTGVSIHKESAHTYLEFQPLSIGVCFVAGYNETKPTDGSEGKLTAGSINRSQLVSFNHIINAWYTVFPGADVFGQNDLDNGDSRAPGFNVGNYVFNSMNKINTCEPTVDKKFLTFGEMIADTYKIGVQ
jgi:hypothetical protein